MIVYGYAKDTKTLETGELSVQVRIPNIHGPYRQADYMGKKVTNFVSDENLPWYKSLLLSRTPRDGDVLALLQDGSDFLVLGLTGGQYSPQQS